MAIRAARAVGLSACEHGILEAEDGTVVGIGVSAQRMVVNPVDGWRNHTTGQDAFQARGQAQVGVVEKGGDKNQRLEN